MKTMILKHIVENLGGYASICDTWEEPHQSIPHGCCNGILIPAGPFKQAAAAIADSPQCAACALDTADWYGKWVNQKMREKGAELIIRARRLCAQNYDRPQAMWSHQTRLDELAGNLQEAYARQNWVPLQTASVLTANKAANIAEELADKHDQWKTEIETAIRTKLEAPSGHTDETMVWGVVPEQTNLTKEHLAVLRLWRQHHEDGKGTMIRCPLWLWEWVVAGTKGCSSTLESMDDQQTGTAFRLWGKDYRTIHAAALCATAL